MSYDIRILSQNEPIFPDCLPLSKKWEHKGHSGYIYHGEDWQILVGTPQKS